MADSKHCVHCDRTIDAHARLCPYCNWDQAETPTAAAPSPQPADSYVPPEEHDKRRTIYMAGGGVALLLVSFALGALIHGANPEETAAKTGGSLVSQTAAPPPQVSAPQGPHANVDLVQVDASAPITETPITSAPAPDASQGVPSEYQRSDATAVSSAEYQQLAAREKIERQQALADPRLLTAPVYAKPRPRPPVQAASNDEAPPPKPQAMSIRTAPRAESISFGNVRVDRDTTIHLTLLIGADGRVHSVDIDGSLPGQTAQLIAAIHNWRFKPATENGVPVPAQFSTAVSFRANE